ncbi:hypothetical protein [Tsuneonella troitsensis]|uniref:hypothetical protein n=1 Tax=Tsuneonella troitsensis TaxID=292222 RepID=UPI00070F58CA|nr:hypothetical protein [Tsuneonella troitsensis]
MKYGFLLAIVATILVGCSNRSTIESDIREGLIDPESARFGELIEYTDDEGDQLACIMVNAKNRMGGYTGEKMMLAVKGEDGKWRGGEGPSGLDCRTFVDSRNS